MSEQFDTLKCLRLAVYLLLATLPARALAEEKAWVTGTSLVVDGGRILG